MSSLWERACRIFCNDLLLSIRACCTCWRYTSVANAWPAEPTRPAGGDSARQAAAAAPTRVAAAAARGGSGGKSGKSESWRERSTIQRCAWHAACWPCMGRSWGSWRCVDPSAYAAGQHAPQHAPPTHCPLPWLSLCAQGVSYGKPAACIMYDLAYHLSQVRRLGCLLARWLLDRLYRCAHEMLALIGCS